MLLPAYNSRFQGESPFSFSFLHIPSRLHSYVFLQKKRLKRMVTFILCCSEERTRSLMRKEELVQNDTYGFRLLCMLSSLSLCLLNVKWASWYNNKGGQKSYGWQESNAPPKSSFTHKIGWRWGRRQFRRSTNEKIPVVELEGMPTSEQVLIYIVIIMIMS